MLMEELFTSRHSITANKSKHEKKSVVNYSIAYR